MDLLRALDLRFGMDYRARLECFDRVLRREANVWFEEFAGRWKSGGRRMWLEFDLCPMADREALLERMSGPKFGLMMMVTFLALSREDWDFVFNSESWFLAAQLDALMEEWHSTSLIHRAVEVKKSMIESAIVWSGQGKGPKKLLESSRALTMSTIIDLWVGADEKKLVIFSVLKIDSVGLILKKHEWVDRASEERIWRGAREVQEEWKVSRRISVLGRLQTMGIVGSSTWEQVKRALRLLSVVDARICVRKYVRRHMACSKAEWEKMNLCLVDSNFSNLRGEYMEVIWGVEFPMDDYVTGGNIGSWELYYSSSKKEGVQAILWSMLEESRFNYLFCLCREFKKSLVQAYEDKRAKAVTLADLRNLTLSSVLDVLPEGWYVADASDILPVKLDAEGRVTLRQWPLYPRPY